MNLYKTSASTLLLLLSLSLLVGLSSTVQAQGSTWMVISLPYTINASGNYRIGGDYVSNIANQQGLIINASHVNVDGQNYRVTVTNSSTGKPSAVYVNSQTDVYLENINVTSSYCGFRVENSTNVTLQGCTVSNGYNIGIQFNSSSGFGINNCTLRDVWGGVSLNGSNSFKIASTSVNRTSYGNGIFAQGCDKFTVSDVDISDSSWNGFCSLLSNNYLLKNSNLHNTLLRFDSGGYHGGQGFLCEAGQNITVSNCVFNKNEGTAIYAQNVGDLEVANNRVTGNAQAATVFLSNATFSGNIFASNGLEAGAYYGGLQSTDSNCTATDNTFTGNYDAVIWESHQNSYSNIFTVQNNHFQSNLYTFFFDYTLRAGATNQKLVFTNNLVNDSAYVDPVGLTQYTNSSFADKVLNLNGTMQAGLRIYGNGPNVGGNFWGHPDGTGPSQTGADVDHDGFINSKFSLFTDASVGSAYDYLPLSTGYAVATTPTPAPTAQPTAMPTSTAAPTGVPTVTPTSTPTSTVTPTFSPTMAPETTHSTAEAPWLLIAVGAVAVLAAVAAGVFVFGKRKKQQA